MTAVLRERNAESAEDAANAADSERLLAVGDWLLAHTNRETKAIDGNFVIVVNVVGAGMAIGG